MVDVDTLSRRFGPIVAEYLCVAILLRNIDITKRPAAYDQDFVSISDPNKLIQLFQIVIYIPVLTTATINTSYDSDVVCSETALVLYNKHINSNNTNTIHSSPIMLYFSPVPNSLPAMVGDGEKVS